MSSAATGAAIGVTVTILLLGLFGGAAFMYRRRQRRGVAHLDAPDGRRSTVLERSHPASRVTPFAAGYSEPCFHHTPGEAMRFARRKSDGGWDFSAPLVLSPSGPSPFDSASTICPSPSSTVAPWYHRKELLPSTPTNRALLDVDPFGVAPPAYTPRSSSSSPSD